VVLSFAAVQQAAILNSGQSLTIKIRRPNGMISAGPTRSVPVSLRSPWFLGGIAIVSFLALIKLGLHLYADRFYGYFVDELYFIACSKHLAAGYVDQPPLIAFIVRFERLLFGDSLQAIRFLPAMAGAARVLLAGWMARELGGKRFAQALAALAALMTTASFALEHYVSMNAFEPIFWMGCAAIVIRIIKTGNQKLWLYFGLLAGLGLENKHTTLLFGFAVFLGVLLSSHRREMLGQKWIWLGALLALLLFLPNLIWNIQHHWPFLELLRNIKADNRSVHLTSLQYILEQFMLTMPVSAPLWVCGLGWLMLSRAGRPFRLLGSTYLVILTCMLVMHGRRGYYMMPCYPMLFAAGAVAFETWFSRPRLGWLKPSYATILAVSGAILAPLGIPILPPSTFIRYVQVLHVHQPRIQTNELGPLPQFYADMFGWEEMVQAVARTYYALPPDQRARTAIFGSNYGQAGAIDLFGKKYGVPDSIGHHQNYWYWGPRNYTGESVISIGAGHEYLEEYFSSVKPIGAVYHPYSMPYEHFDIYYCQGIKEPISESWPKMKNWH
jgi:hypothetical protein